MSTFKKLLALGITVGLADRNQFVKKVSGVIETYQNEPEKADEWAKAIAKYLEELKQDIRMQHNLKAETAPNQNIEDLTKAVQELTKQLQKQK